MGAEQAATIERHGNIERIPTAEWDACTGAEDPLGRGGTE